jgi:hypothetical protein
VKRKAVDHPNRHQSFDERTYDQPNADHHSNRQSILGCRARAQSYLGNSSGDENWKSNDFEHPPICSNYDRFSYRKQLAVAMPN